MKTPIKFPITGINIDIINAYSHNGKQGVRMRIISRARLRDFWDNHKYRDAEQPLKADLMK